MMGHRATRGLVTVVAVVVLLASGCSGGDGGASDGSGAGWINDRVDLAEKQY